MSTFNAFLLASAAFVGTLMLIINPTSKLTEWLRGKKPSEIGEQAETWVEDHDLGHIALKGCGFGLFLILSLFYTFVVEPIAALFALINKIGYQPIAYVMLVIVAAAWFQFAWVFTHQKQAKQTSNHDKDEVVKMPNQVLLGLWRAIYSLPTLYLWYLFLVGIGTLP